MEMKAVDLYLKLKISVNDDQLMELMDEPLFEEEKQERFLELIKQSLNQNNFEITQEALILKNGVAYNNDYNLFLPDQENELFIDVPVSKTYS